MNSTKEAGMDGVYFWDTARGYGIPPEVESELPESIEGLTFTSHAIKEAKTDRYGVINIPRQVALKDVQVTEVNVICGQIKYISCRLSHDDYCDVTLIIDVPSNTLVTCWLNNKYDHHETSNLSRYRKLTA
jgi:hypothetical protein